MKFYYIVSQINCTSNEILTISFYLFVPSEPWTELLCFTFLIQLNTRMKLTHSTEMKPLHLIHLVQTRTEHTLTKYNNQCPL
jgi:hypothetical protein